MPVETKDTVYWIISIACVGLGWWLNYHFVAQPALEETKRFDQHQIEVASQQADEQKKRADDLERRNRDIRGRWEAARYISLSTVNRAVQDATKPPSAWERQTRPPNAYLAHQIVEARDKLRDQISQIQGGLQFVSDSLDSTIDAIKDTLNHQPIDQKRLAELLARLGNEWPTKSTSIEDKVVALFTELGCPQLTASR